MDNNSEIARSFSAFNLGGRKNFASQGEFHYPEIFYFFSHEKFCFCRSLRFLIYWNGEGFEV